MQRRGPVVSALSRRPLTGAAATVVAVLSGCAYFHPGGKQCFDVYRSPMMRGVSLSAAPRVVSGYPLRSTMTVTVHEQGIALRLYHPRGLFGPTERYSCRRAGVAEVEIWEQAVQTVDGVLEDRRGEEREVILSVDEQAASVGLAATEDLSLAQLDSLQPLLCLVLAELGELGNEALDVAGPRLSQRLDWGQRCAAPAAATPRSVAP